MKKEITRAFLLLSFLAFTSDFAICQEDSKISPYVQLQYFKNNDENSYLKATLTYSMNRMEIPVPGMTIEFYSGSDRRTRISEVVTDEKGVAVYYLNKKSDFIVDQDGYWPFISVYAGNDTIESGESELLIKDLTMNVEFTEIDSIRTIVVNARMIENSEEMPVQGEIVTVFVPRMFSMLPVGEIILDDSGNGSLEFPTDLPGDKDGNLTIIVRLEEHPDFGNLEKSSIMKWGVPASAIVHSSHRALWTKTAPRWMIYTLSVLLAGVWGHYLFAFISLIRIRRSAKKEQVNLM